MITRKIAAIALLAALGSAILACANEKVIYEGQSQYNTILVTEDAQGLRTLRFEQGGARQSVVKPGDPDHLELQYARAILSAFAFCPQPRRALIVGLGGGTIPMFLRKHYPELTIDLVEIDPAVFDVAKKYFGFREDAKMRVHIEDGRKFIADSDLPYDILFLDAFDCDSVPYHLATREFLEIVRPTVRPTGAVVANIWDRSTNRLHDAMVRTYQEVFDEVYLFPVPHAGNQILVALPHPQRLSPVEVRRRAAEIAQQRNFPFDLGEFIANRFQRLQEKDPSARVLVDGKEPAP